MINDGEKSNWNVLLTKTHLINRNFYSYFSLTAHQYSPKVYAWYQHEFDCDDKTKSLTWHDISSNSNLEQMRHHKPFATLSELSACHTNKIYKINVRMYIRRWNSVVNQFKSDLMSLK